MISGCEDDQTSLDSRNELNENIGAFTNALIECLQKSHHNIDIITLYKSICKYLNKKGYNQKPLLSSSTSSPYHYFIS